MDQVFVLFELTALALALIAIAIAAWKVSVKTGRSGFWSALLLIPVVGPVLFVGFLAVAPWPALEEKG